MDTVTVEFFKNTQRLPAAECTSQFSRSSPLRTRGIRRLWMLHSDPKSTSPGIDPTSGDCDVIRSPLVILAAELPGVNIRQHRAFCHT